MLYLKKRTHFRNARYCTRAGKAVLLRGFFGLSNFETKTIV